MTERGASGRDVATRGPDAKLGRPRWRRGPRSLSIEEWPRADQNAWREACRSGCRLKLGGTASHLGEISRGDLVRRYGAFLSFLDRNHRLDLESAAASQVTPANVADYTVELQSRVRSVTTWNCIYKLRRMAQLIAVYGGSTPYLASALLNHRDPRVTEEHYNRATSMSAAQAYAAIIETIAAD